MLKVNPLVVLCVIFIVALINFIWLQIIHAEWILSHHHLLATRPYNCSSRVQLKSSKSSQLKVFQKELTIKTLFPHVLKQWFSTSRVSRPTYIFFLYHSCDTNLFHNIQIKSTKIKHKSLRATKKKNICTHTHLLHFPVNLTDNERTQADTERTHNLNSCCYAAVGLTILLLKLLCVLKNKCPTLSL